MILTYIYKYIERLSINAKMLRRNRGSVMEFHFWSTYNMNDTNIKCRQFHHTFVWPRIRAGICKNVTFCLLLPVSFSWVYIQCCMFCMENPMLRSCSSRSTRCVSSAYFSWFYSIRIIMNLRHWFLGKNNLDFKPLHVYDSKFQFCYEILEFGRINCNCYVLNGNEWRKHFLCWSKNFQLFSHVVASTTYNIKFIRFVHFYKLTLLQDIDSQIFLL